MNEIPGVALPKSVKRDLKIGRTRTKRVVYNNFRTVMSTNLPLCFRGATPLRPDPSHPPSNVGGICKRFGYGTPKLDRKTKRQFRRFIQLWLKRNMVPLVDSDIPSLEEWLEKTPYSQGRKVELLDVYHKWCEDGMNFELFRMVKSFIKDETYPEWKFPRIINSRVDPAKCYFGPAVQAVSDRMFDVKQEYDTKFPWFIKKVPVPDRPMVIRDALLSADSNEDYIFTDYTAFEAHFVKDVMDVTQFELFKYMLKNTAGFREWFDVYKDTMGGTNKMAFKHFSAQIEATRMSGEMDTSLSNGFANLMLFLFVAYSKGATSVKGFVEGDDGLFKVSPASATPTEEDFAKLGFTIKIGHTKKLSEASFCGQVYDMTDLKVVTDPIEVILRLGWTNKKYVMANDKTRMQLLRSRGYSLVYQYQGCPILDVLGRRILELTEGVVIEDRILNNMDQWEREKLRAAMAAKLPEYQQPGQATRDLVARLYGVSIEKQLQLEKEFSSINLGVHDNPFEDVPQSWTDYYEKYSVGYFSQDPCWLVKSETEYLDRLKNLNCCSAFISSL